MERAEIEKLLSLDADGLYSLLPAYSPKYEETLFCPDGQLEAGKNIFDELKRGLYEKVCVEWEYCKKKSLDQYQDPVVLVSAIGDVVSTAITGIPPFVVSALLVKIGLSRFCECR